MTILNVTDINSGEIISVDTTNPTGTIHVLDADTGNILSINLASPSGVITVVDADTGDFIDLDYSNLTGTVTIVDSNTGRFVDIDFDNPAGLFYTIDENTGDLVQIDLNTDTFFKSGNLIIPSLGSSDTTPPTVVIILSQYTFKIGETATVTFTFSEEVMNFTVADVTSPNGSLSSFTVTGNPLIYTATFTPTNSVTDATNVITVGTGWTDAAGNAPVGSTNSSNYTVDTVAPTCTITCTQTSPSNAATFNFTFTFSEIVTGFVIGDITVAGGTIGNFAGSGAVYTADVTPTAYEVTVDVGAGVCVDAAGNPNTVATQKAMSALTKWYLAGAIPAANCKVAYQPIGAASLAASKVNLANPGTNDATTADSDPDFNTATGWQFTAANSDSLNTGWVPPNQVTRSGIARISGASTDAASRFVFSSRNGGAIFGIRNTDAASKANFINGTGTTFVHSTNVASGVLAVAGLNPYVDAVDVGDIPSGTYDQSTVGVIIGKLTTGGSYFNGFMQAAAFYDISLTPTQITALTAAMNALP